MLNHHIARGIGRLDIVLLSATLLLAGCGSTSSTYRASHDPDDDPDAEELAEERRNSSNVKLAIMSGLLAGLQGRAGGAAMPAYVPPSTYQPQRTHSAPGKRTVNECISIRTNQWGSRQFFNGCAFTVGIAWCSEDPASPYACQGGLTSRGVNFIGPGKEAGGPGKSGRAHWAACEGGPASGNLPTLQNGRASCG